jgi:hypothetical protein
VSGGIANGIASVALDGELQQCPQIMLVDDRRDHELVVRLYAG